MNATQIYAELVRLRDQAGMTIHERLKLADQLLSDRGWVTALDGGGGDEGTALDRLEDECFPDAPMGLPDLLELLHEIPQVSVWKKHKFKVKKMLVKVRERKRASLPTSPKPKGSDGANEGTPRITVAQMPQPIRDEFATLKQENAQLRKEVRELVAENHKLRLQLERIRGLVGDLQETA